MSGSATIAGAEREFDVGGMRSAALPLDGRDSLRLFAAWFPAGHEIAAARATRPKGAKGHDRDSVGVVARGEEHQLVIDPRLSTTYDHSGEPRRVGLELWLGDDEEGEVWPRRVAGAATGSRLESPGLGAYAFECVSRGEPGAGVYVLAHRLEPSGRFGRGGLRRLRDLVLAAEAVPAVELEALGRELHAAALREPREHRVERLVLAHARVERLLAAEPSGDPQRLTAVLSE